MKHILLIFALLLIAPGLRAQTTAQDYYAPYNFPNKYESDKLNKNLSLSFALPLGSKFYGLQLYSDVARIRITEFMNINFGLGAMGGYSNDKKTLYEISGEKAFVRKTVLFGRVMAGGGLTFRLANPLNLSVRSGITGSYELYKTSEVRPLLVNTGWQKLTYDQRSEYFRPGFFYNVTIFYKLKKIALGLSHGVYYMATGPELINSIGFVFPIGN